MLLKYIWGLEGISCSVKSCITGGGKDSGWRKGWGGGGRRGRFLLLKNYFSIFYIYKHMNNNEMHSPIPSLAWEMKHSHHTVFSSESALCIRWQRPWCWEKLRAREEGGHKDEMVGWHHQLNGHEFEKAPGDGEGQGNLVCCSPWGHRELDTT